MHTNKHESDRSGQVDTNATGLGRQGDDRMMKGQNDYKRRDQMKRVRVASRCIGTELR
jgi:hypothetical protein